MRIAFIADEAGFDSDEDALVCGVTGEGHYLTFQRDAENSQDDWGIYLEYDDQSNGDYECVATCRLSSHSLSVDLARPLSRQLERVSGFELALKLTAERWAALRDGLRQVFRGHQVLLEETEPNDTRE